MDNPHNILITKSEIEFILNNFGNIGDDNSKLSIKNVNIYQKAFVHESYFQSIQNVLLNDFPIKQVYLNFTINESNERLEFLGDSILKYTMGEYIYTRYSKHEREKFMSKLKMKLESGKMLHKIALELGFKKYLLLSLQVDNQTILGNNRGRNTPSYYEDAFEAFIGAIKEDFGEYGVVYATRFTRNVMEHVIDFSELNSTNTNYKDSLQKYFQSNGWDIPKYKVINNNETEPTYRKNFIRVIFVKKENESPENSETEYTEYLENSDLTIPNDHYILGIGRGNSTKEAEQDCARQCLLNLNVN